MRVRISALIKAFILGLLSYDGLSAKQPNIIVIMADDLGYADMSFLVHAPADVQTPGIDQLAAEGFYFTNAYSTSPICSPSRVGFMTGRYQQRWGNYWYGEGGLPWDEKTIAQYLKELGYYTMKIGKVHTNRGPAEHPLDHGFDEFLGFIHHTHDFTRLSHRDVEAYEERLKGSARSATIGPLIRGRDESASYEKGFTTRIFTEEAVDYINREHSQPFYLQLEHNAVHMPTYVTDPYYDQKVGLGHSPWNRDAEDWHFPYWDPAKETWQQWHSKWGHLGAVDTLGRKRYLSHLAALDDSVSAILRALAEKGIEDKTILVFLSDNGGTINTYSNNYPLSGYKFMFGEGGIRIPIIIKIPEAEAVGRSFSQLASAMDILPTLVQLAGGEIADNLDGKSLLPLIEGKEPVNHKQLFWDKGRDDSWVVRKGDWKLAHKAGWIHLNYALDVEGIAKRAPDYAYPDGILLFNLEHDIAEQENLFDIHPEKVKELTKAYQTWRKQMSRPLGRSELPQFTSDITLE